MKRILITTVLAVLLGLLGLYCGALLGAYSDQIILGQRGYEGQGLLGLIIGIFVGALIGVYFTRKR